MTRRWHFPTFDHDMWRNDSDVLPGISDDTLAPLCSSAEPSSRQQYKSYVFAVEAYTLPSSVSTNVCDSSLRIVCARATRYRSQKKAGLPYKVLVTFGLASGAITGASCACPAGTSGACSHVLATLHLIVLLKQKGFREAPPELSCTELPQQWRRPRREGISSESVQDVDWRSSRECGVPVPVPLRLFDAHAKMHQDQQQLKSFHELGASLDKLGNHHFAAVLRAATGTFAETRLGHAPAGSPLSYQQAKLPAGFKTWVSSSLSRGSGTLGPVPGGFLFDGTSQHTFSDAFSPDEWSILAGVHVTPEEARELELNSRQQARSTCSQEARSNRLTASRFGQVDARDEWTQKGLENLIEPKDLSRVRAAQYERNNEGAACDRYSSVMKSWGHNVSVQHCELVVNPSCPWLGASPDRLVYDPEGLTYGVLEVKCPYFLRDS
ncbi:unnamed protein product [Ixodes persulcatus]